MFRIWNDLVMVEDLERLGYATHATAESGVALTPALRRPAAGRRACFPHA